MPIVLATYGIAVGKTQTPKLLDPFQLPRNRSLYGELNSFLNATIERPTRPDGKDFFKAQKVTTINERKSTFIEVYGKISYSRFGKEYQIAHTEDPARGLVQTKKHAREEPYFFYFEFRPDQPWSIMILERAGNGGIKDVFFRLFSEYFRLRNGSDINLRSTQLVPKSLVSEAISGGVKTLRLTQHAISSDEADRFGLRGYEEDIQEIRVVVKAKPNKLLPLRERIAKVTGGSPVSSLASLRDLRPERASVTVTMGGRERVVRVTQGDTSVNAYWDVSKDVREGDDGHGVESDLLREARSLRDLIRTELQAPE